MEQVVLHPKFDRRNELNDMAVLKLSKRVNLTDTIQPICLPTEDERLENEFAYVAGDSTYNLNKFF